MKSGAALGRRIVAFVSKERLLVDRSDFLTLGFQKNAWRTRWSMSSAMGTLPSVMLPQKGFTFETRRYFSSTGSTEEKDGQHFKPEHIVETKWYETPFNARVFDILKLLNFSKNELESVFNRLDLNQNGFVERQELKTYLKELCVKEDRETAMTDKELDEFVNTFMQRFGNGSGEISKDQFQKVILEMANTVDRRVWPITGSMIFTGCAIGIVIPVMPLFVKELGLNASEFGMVVSAFGLSKLMGNIPCAFLADKHGRKAVMTAGLGLISIGMGGIAFSNSLSTLVACRLISGIGASAFTSASMLYLMDIGTPFTRTKTMAPISAGFSAGAALGPAIGGASAYYLGLENTFLMVGSMFVLLTISNNFTLSETLKPHQRIKGTGFVSELQETTKQWVPLLSDGKYRAVLMMNVMYWYALSGSYMTLLPMMLVRDEWGLSSAELGGVFAMTSAVQVISTQPAAWVADRFGKIPAIVFSSFLVSGAMFAFPIMPSITPALGVLALWSLGGTMFGMAPTAHVTDIVPAHHRSQALALLRTMGDIGLLLGASLTGAVSDYLTPTVAMQANAGLLLGTSMWFAYRETRKS